MIFQIILHLSTTIFTDAAARTRSSMPTHKPPISKVELNEHCSEWYKLYNKLPQTQLNILIPRPAERTHQWNAFHFSGNAPFPAECVIQGGQFSNPFPRRRRPRASDYSRGPQLTRNLGRAFLAIQQFNHPGSYTAPRRVRSVAPRRPTSLGRYS